MTDHATPPQPERLSKLMAQRGLCSRREADEFIAHGLVFVDGIRVDVLGTKVLPHQTIQLAPEARRAQRQLVTLLLHKPVGYVSGQPEDGHLAAVELITPERNARPDPVRPLLKSHFRGLAPAGRLDIDSRGLLVFTQDGRIARRLTDAQGRIAKQYLVGVEGSVTEEVLKRLRHGLELDGRPLRPADVERAGAGRLRIVLREGRHRQIRRMAELVGLRVVSLIRTAIGRVPLGDLPEGKWRFLDEGEEF